MTPTAHTTTPSTSPAAPQMVVIHLSAAPVALTAMPIRYATAVIAATERNAEFHALTSCPAILYAEAEADVREAVLAIPPKCKYNRGIETR